MKQHLYEPTLFLRDGKEWIKGFTMERPEQSNYEDFFTYEKKLLKFLASSVKYPVCEGSKDAFHNHTNWDLLSDTENSNIEIRIDELADRLEVVSQ